MPVVKVGLMYCNNSIAYVISNELAVNDRSIVIEDSTSIRFIPFSS